MRRSGLVAATVAFILALGSQSRADTPAAPLPPLPSASASAPSPPPASAPAASPIGPLSSPPPAAQPPPVPSSPRAAPAGVAVLASGGATDAAWPLAQSVYSTASIRPPSVDEVHARVLCGEPPPAGAAAEVRDLADTVAAVRGEDAASRAILADMARKLNVRALIVVHLEAGKPVARLFLADTQSFDAASYGPDLGPTLAWSLTTSSLARSFGGPPPAPTTEAPPPPESAPPLATHEEPALANPPPKPKAFYESGWFWGALGAAAFAGGAVFFATRDNSASTIHLDMQVPH